MTTPYRRKRGSIDLFSVLTFNCHGYNQAESLLTDVCDNNKYQLIFLQEHWLTSNNLSKFNKFSNYNYFGISAMNNTIQNNVLYGRPHGGVLTMINKSFSMNIVPLLIKERVVILSINNLIIINAYLPCRDNS